MKSRLCLLRSEFPTLPMKITALMACHNRREKTLACLRSLAAQKPCGAELAKILVDDGSCDGTAEAVTSKYPEVRILSGDGSLYWCGAMRMGWKAAAEDDPDYYLLVNDDTTLYPDAVETLVQTARDYADAAIVVGAICDPDTGQISYGGVHQNGGLIKANGIAESCYTFNANCALIPRAVYRSRGIFYHCFTHGLGDFDYGIQATRRGIKVIQTGRHVGTCKDNPVTGTWSDRSLSRRKRLQLLQSPKGLPVKEWFEFNRRNSGWLWPLYFVSPFYRILLGR